MPEITASGSLSIRRFVPTSVQSAGSPEHLNMRSPVFFMRRGCVIVKPCETPEQSLSGATTYTVWSGERISISVSKPAAPKPSSFVNKTVMHSSQAKSTAAPPAGFTS